MKKNKKSSSITEDLNMSQHYKALRLVKGGFVWQNGHYIGARKVDSNDIPCHICDMDSICNPEMAYLCEECEYLSHKKHLLYLVAYRDNH